MKGRALMAVKSNDAINEGCLTDRPQAQVCMDYRERLVFGYRSVNN
jgi:hypothetical protein